MRATGYCIGDLSGAHLNPPISVVFGVGRRGATLAILLPILMALCSCQDLVPRDTQSLLIPRFQRSEIVGLVAGFGTTFAALPDLIGMLRRRSSAGFHPRMAGIIGAFQLLWIYYGLLIASRPVVLWNVIAVFVNFLSVGAYIHFIRREKTPVKTGA